MLKGRGACDCSHLDQHYDCSAQWYWQIISQFPWLNVCSCFYVWQEREDKKRSNFSMGLPITKGSSILCPSVSIGVPLNSTNNQYDTWMNELINQTNTASIYQQMNKADCQAVNSSIHHHPGNKTINDHTLSPSSNNQTYVIDSWQLNTTGKALKRADPLGKQSFWGR